MLLTFAMFPSTRRFTAKSTTESQSDRSQLTDRQWLIVEDLFPWVPPTRAGGRPKVPPRACLEGILWVLRSGARWKDLPDRFPSYATCWRRLNEWAKSGLFIEAWARLVQMSDDLKQLDWEHLIADGTFVRAKKGGI